MSNIVLVLTETWPLEGASTVIPCLHAGHTPIFNASACVYQSTSWIAEHYPRYEGPCQVCHQRVRIWASIEHMIALNYGR